MGTIPTFCTKSVRHCTRGASTNPPALLGPTASPNNTGKAPTTIPPCPQSFPVRRPSPPALLPWCIKKQREKLHRQNREARCRRRYRPSSQKIQGCELSPPWQEPYVRRPHPPAFPFPDWNPSPTIQWSLANIGPAPRSAPGYQWTTEKDSPG